MSRARTALAVLLVCLPVAAACTTVASAALAIATPAAVDYGEPVVYGQAERLLTGQPLYQPIDQQPFTVAAYTPLYYWAAAGLQRVVGPGFGPGRALSLLSGVVSAILIGVLTGRRGGVWVGAFGGLLFLALAFPGHEPPWLGLYRVDMLGVALSLSAVAVLSWSSGTRALVVAGVLAGLAVLCKQTLVAALIAGVLWQLRRSAPMVATAILTVAIPCLLLEAATGGAFLENTVSPNENPFYVAVAAGLLAEFVKAQWLPLVLAGAYLWLARPWTSDEGRLLVLYWLAASLSLVLIGKIGANHNYWIEFAAATAILAGRGAACLLSASTTRRARAGAVGLVVLVGAPFVAPPGPFALARDVHADLGALASTSAERDFETLVDRVRREPRDVIAEPMDTVVLAGRQVVLEPVIYSILFDTGHWRPGPLVDRICSGAIGLVVLGYPLEVAARMTDGLHALWPAPIIAALQERMQLDGRQAARYVYVPRPLAVGRASDGCSGQVAAA